MIDALTAQKIKDAADIVEVVSDYVHLTRRGANYMGLCPFHNERTPSFSVSKHKNFCFCFSCKKGGSPVNFIMEKEGLSYQDALRHLAKKYGIEIVEREMTDKERAEQTEREAMLVANEWAMNHMEKTLFDTDEGRDVGLQYFMQRGVTDEAIRKFHLGYAIDRGSEMVEAAKRAGYDLEVLKKLGLVGTSQSGRDYDRFHGRVIFPIQNSAGKVIAFGGRDLKGGPAKYINSPESNLYKKSNELYGIYQARADIVRENRCFLVEGYLDVIGMWQSGMRNTVASSGTALTDGQIALIHRFSENITLIYDGDKAGIKAALRGIDMLLSHNMKVKVLLLPDGDDPDSFARKHTPEEFKQYVEENETDIIRFKTKVLMADVKRDPQTRIDAVNSVVTSLAHISDPISRDVYIQECSAILGVSEDTIAKSVARMRDEIVEKLKREHTKSQFPDAQKSNANTQTQPVNIVPESKGNKSILTGLNLKTERFRFLEGKVLEYCVKYGFFDLCDSIESENNDEEEYLSVIDFVNEELDADNLRFSFNVYCRIFELLKKMEADFAVAVNRYQESVEEQVNQKRREGINEIAATEDLSMADIKRKEKMLDQELAEFRKNMLAEFTKDYAPRILASHEDGEIRNVVSEMIRDRHQLSQIYLKDGQAIEKDEDKLDVLVPRALTEWKSEILNQKMQSLLTELSEIRGKDVDREQELQRELYGIMKIRTQVAKNIGDRILDPRNKQK